MHSVRQIYGYSGFANPAFLIYEADYHAYFRFVFVSAFGNVSPDIIAGIIREADADIVALQEVDAQKSLSTNRNQAQTLAKKLGIDADFIISEQTDTIFLLLGLDLKWTVTSHL